MHENKTNYLNLVKTSQIWFNNYGEYVRTLNPFEMYTIYYEYFFQKFGMDRLKTQKDV